MLNVPASNTKDLPFKHIVGSYKEQWAETQSTCGHRVLSVQFKGIPPTRIGLPGQRARRAKATGLGRSFLQLQGTITERDDPFGQALWR